MGRFRASRRDIVTEARRFNAGNVNRIARVPTGRLNRWHVIRELSFPLCFQHKGTSPPVETSARQTAWPFLGGIARQNKMKAMEVGGVEDHVHILLSLPATLAISKALQLIKGGSSKWIHDTFPEHRSFAWQEQYSAFSVSVSQMENIIQYIKDQEIHHRRMTFQEELLALLKKHRIEYDDRYLWD